jgi:hypothetical protein
VTVDCQTAGMRYDHSQVGVCVIRIEAHSGGVLLTVRRNADIEQVSTEQVRILTDVETSIQLVREFLEAFAAAAQGR